MKLSLDAAHDFIGAFIRNTAGCVQPHRDDCPRCTAFVLAWQVSAWQEGGGEKVNLKDLDRLTIIYRKWVEERLRSGEVENKWLREAGGLTKGATDELQLRTTLALGAINAAIWERQDELRRMKEETLHADDVAETAFALVDLNDWRAQIIGEEKL